MQQQIEQLQGPLPKQDWLHLIIAKHCILYTMLNPRWKIKGNIIFLLRHPVYIIWGVNIACCVLLSGQKSQNHIFQWQKSMILHAKNDYFESTSLQGFLQEIGLKSACCWLLFILPGMLQTQQTASPSAGNGCVYQQVVFHFHMFQTLMRFGFDFSCPWGKRREG